jgi:hypothetical protein
LKSDWWLKSVIETGSPNQPLGNPHQHLKLISMMDFGQQSEEF